MKAKIKSFSYKKIPRSTGLLGVAEAGKEWHDIKLDGKKVGYLSKYGWDRPFTINFMVEKDDIMEDGNPNCTWKWVHLKYTSSSLEDIKVFLKNHAGDIQDRYRLHSHAE